MRSLSISVVERMSRVLGEEHFYTLMTTGLLAEVCRKQGREDEAQQLENRIEELRKDSDGSWEVNDER